MTTRSLTPMLAAKELADAITAACGHQVPADGRAAIEQWCKSVWHRYESDNGSILHRLLCRRIRQTGRETLERLAARNGRGLGPEQIRELQGWLEAGSRRRYGALTRLCTPPEPTEPPPPPPRDPPGIVA